MCGWRHLGLPMFPALPGLSLIDMHPDLPHSLAIQAVKEALSRFRKLSTTL